MVRWGGRRAGGREERGEFSVHLRLCYHAEKKQPPAALAHGTDNTPLKNMPYISHA